MGIFEVVARSLELHLTLVYCFSPFLPSDVVVVVVVVVLGFCFRLVLVLQGNVLISTFKCRIM